MPLLSQRWRTHLISATQSRLADGDGMAKAFGRYFCPSSALAKSDTSEKPLALMKAAALSPGMPNTKGSPTAATFLATGTRADCRSRSARSVK